MGEGSGLRSLRGEIFAKWEPQEHLGIIARCEIYWLLYYGRHRENFETFSRALF